ncbi:hypothetical protein M406DRAFT_286427 [Cryphonectria parasitica EP155]|uniref:PD-(D/E)XK nuclease-like domain-containing protein n=1 Tax=Cryphonectria parasitica (strain ATCC 38755 / EP155) TaxID=660469 RepID=A0A9P4Y841_CRYP1|nr:uncharacterized protein M406DRAFT_286427 [Cryphonectria parasitica EP155]KAF3768496.1 hypothetical protein M406DRAFT_286427 [Cryphonectria parasitica EP155]
MVESPAIADTSLFSAPLPFHYTSDGAEQKKRDSLGPTPSVDQVLCVLDWAQQCALRAAEEAMWNSAVHFPLLKMAVHGGGRVPAGGDTTTVGLTQCTTARIIQEYLPIYAIRQSSLWQSINHTFFEGLLDRPIVLSCESKRLDSEGTIQATLQIGLWHAAQWKHLKTLAVQQQSSSQLPTFLPAVIISGHDWLFAATTQVQNKTILWKEYPFGHTRDAWGVYRIICGLQRLKAWALNDYWPWYRGHILGLAT